MTFRALRGLIRELISSLLAQKMVFYEGAVASKGDIDFRVDKSWRSTSRLTPVEKDAVFELKGKAAAVVSGWDDEE